MYRKMLVSVIVTLTIFEIVCGMPAKTVNASIICQLPEVKGPCRALFWRWSYDPVTKTCHEFVFGGCKGNGNNFESYNDCMSVCAGE
ncbi:Papilin-like Protein [Tribolium castaneum]|uniref:Papilin-like Protein n=1 Tax=Tribolium castaneum TaxID=7070 RepID=A0A139WEX6_TRICA|nr:PREDICTED: proteinase inhibitor-like [Tribolium castaneum]KYB26494.1 Papilin-like Protein [Tribolium castaneum]|eukprot:XP_008195722.1 PREDICTED: proteinase inhibitor-like [Tribolium castaneum]